MRMLGSRTSLASFRWDLVYLLARLSADGRSEVKALATRAQAMRSELAAQRALHEQAEDDVVLASALVDEKDERRDVVVKELGGVARTTDKGTYGILFPKLNPSHTARLPIDEESDQIARILGELEKLDAANPLRTAYLADLTDAEAALKTASQQSDKAVTALALQRSQTDRLKLSMDKGRLEIHGKLEAIVRDKAVADSFFRPTVSSPDEAAKKEPALVTAKAPASVAAPAPGPAPTPA